MKSVFAFVTARSLRLGLMVFLCVGLSACPGTGSPAGSNAPGQNSPNSNGPGSNSPGSQAAPNVDACTLITRTEAESLMGELREAPKPGLALRDEKVCSYGPNIDGANATLRVYGSDQWSTQLGIDSEMNRIPLPGLGDEAYYTLKGSDTDLWTRKGGVVVNINGSVGNVTASQLAAKALSRL
ncbi:MAG: hypothetical protein ACAI44_37845 [Candidatus Sericytochromatia bacterium]